MLLKSWITSSILLTKKSCLKSYYEKSYVKSYLVGGLNPSEKYEFFSWDDFPFPTLSGSQSKIHGSSHHQPDMLNHKLNGYGSIPIDTIFTGMNIQLF